ncbi:MAG TPA: UDP-N-acetylglucosamine 1-carboxyvinyltransferase [Rhizomicrobium sp.]|jgi:UDP-N-acetylglucosamine 1-carboxyvinyltransferase|nr:UDP-N-acetylglucosamine 1-carboxyvinyltransferase [Rhizomicrobium sp.]
MDRIRIEGGARLSGAIPISGAKNAALPLMAAALLTESPLVLSNVPKLVDIAFMAELLTSFGVRVEREHDTLRISAATIRSTIASYDLVRKMRASFWVLGPLVARMGEAKVSLPGGCAIGARPVDLHIRALLALGAAIELREGYVIATAPKGLRGARIEFPTVSVGATEHALMAAALARGESVLVNAAREPEVVDLGRCLRAMGAQVAGLGTSEIVVQGAKFLRGAEHRVLPDRIETGTYAFAAAIAGGDVELCDTNCELIDGVLRLLRATGSDIETTPRGIRIRRDGDRPAAADVSTAPYPGFPTDLQAQYMALMTMANGTSRIRETIFENRFMHVPELGRMGADIHIDGDTATVTGVRRLKGAPVMATDLRASVGLVLAGLAAEGETIVNRVYHLDRGFERLEEKLSGVGAQIERLSS